MQDIEWRPYAKNAVPCDNAELDAFEEEVGAKLPDDYREFLTAHAGEANDLGPIEIGNGDTPFGAAYYLDRFVPKRSAHMNGWVTLRLLREWLGDDNAALAPIAWNNSVGTFVYDLRGGPGQAIKFFDRNYDPDQAEAIFDIATDIADLLSKASREA